MIYFDIETDGFVESMSKIHCLVIKHSKTGEIQRFNKDITKGLKLLMESDCSLVAHNGIKFDIPAIQKLYPWFIVDEERVLDTLVMSRVIHADLTEIDTRLLAKQKLDKKSFKSHSLKAWGERLGENKGDYDMSIEENRLNWSQEMEDYCVQDVQVLEKLHLHLINQNPSPQSLVLEHKVAWIICQQERNGFLFDIEAAQKLHSIFVGRKLELEQILQDVFKPWTVESEPLISKVNNVKLGRIKGQPYTKSTTIIFNPGSRQHIASRLSFLYGWKPKEFTPSGQPKIDETIISSLEYPEAEPLSEYLMLSKRLGQLSDGDQAWLKKVKDDERIHGQVITNGAVTGRATHNNPNMGQVPSVTAKFGSDCRGLFKVPVGKSLVGADLSGLELRCLAHYMGQFDEGKYTRILLEGDIHSANQEAAGLDTRAQAKTFIYGFLYGAGAAKLGEIVGGSAKQGQVLKDTFLRKTPALKKLINGVTAFAEKNGYLPGLDKRKLTVRSPHAALNTLLQSAGALIAKQALIIFRELLLKNNYQDRALLVAWIHDEIQIEVDKEIADAVGQLAVKAFELAGEHFNFRCPITGEYKVGSNWAETH